MNFPPSDWGRLTRSEIKHKCYACGTKNNLAQQLCGFWFCFFHIEQAIEVGASFWLRLNRAFFPERL